MSPSHLSSIPKPSIIICRPEPYAHDLQQKLELHLKTATYSADLVQWPMIDFRASDLLTEPSKKSQFLQKIDESDLVIFISQQAVNFCFEPLNSEQQQVFNRKHLIAVGSGTQKALGHFGLNSFIPKTPNSEGIVALVKDLSASKNLHNICLVRGDQGRTLMEKTFQEHHELSIFQAYHRIVLEQTPEKLKAIQQLVTPKLIVTTSQQILQLTLDNIPKAQHNDFSYLCISERLDAFADKMSIKSRIIAKNASNDAIIESAINWLESKL